MWRWLIVCISPCFHACYTRATGRFGNRNRKLRTPKLGDFRFESSRNASRAAPPSFSRTSVGSTSCLVIVQGFVFDPAAFLCPFQSRECASVACFVAELLVPPPLNSGGPTCSIHSGATLRLGRQMGLCPAPARQRQFQWYHLVFGM